MATDGKLGRSQIDASDALYEFQCNPCAKDGKNMEAIFKCMDCQIFYCHRCVSGHNKFTENHNVLDKTSKLFGQGQRQTRSFSLNELPTDLCEEHHGEVIKMFCGQHDLVCCTVCVAVKHRSCEGVEYIPNIAKGLLKKQDKDKTETSLEKVKDDLQNLKSKMQDELKELNVQRDGILDDIQTFKKRLVTKIEELERKSIKEVQDKHKEITEKITTSSKKIDDILNDVEQQLDKLKQFRSNNEAQLFVDIKVGEEKISAGSNCAMQSAAKKITTLVFEVNKSIETCLSEVQSIGKLPLQTADDGFEVEVEYGYEAEQSEELTIQVGDIIKNVTMCEGGWWEGELGGKRGIFPRNFVKVSVNFKRNPVITVSCEGVEYIPNIAKGLLKKQNKDKTKTSLEKVKDDLQNLKTKMQNELKELNVQRDGILDDIQKFKKCLITKIEEMERKSIKEMQDTHKEIADEITSSSKKIDDMLKDVEQQLNKHKHVKSDNEAQLFVDIKVGEEKCKHQTVYCQKDGNFGICGNQQHRYLST